MILTILFSEPEHHTSINFVHLNSQTEWLGIHSVQRCDFYCAVAAIAMDTSIGFATSQIGNRMGIVGIVRHTVNFWKKSLTTY